MESYTSLTFELTFYLPGFVCTLQWVWGLLARERMSLVA
jgi:hypothetical protein